MAKTLYEKFSAFPPVKFIRRKANKIILPGFQGLSIYEVWKFFYRGIVQGSITSRASSVAFSFFLAIFPAFLFLFTLIAFLPIEGLEPKLMELLSGIMPANSFQAAKPTINDILDNKRGNLLSVGFILAIYFATNGISSLIANFNNTIHQIETRSFFRQQFVSILLTLSLSVLLIISISLLIVSDYTINYFVDRQYLEESAAVLLSIAEYIIVIAMVFFAISILYYYGPSKKKEWRLISPGAILAMILTVITSLGFGYYVSNFSQYNKLYGSIGTLIIILLWIYINAISLLIGFELNASINSAKIRHIEKEDED